MENGGKLLPQAREFKYLGVLFMSIRKIEFDMERQFAAASAGMLIFERDSRGEEEAEPKLKALYLPNHPTFYILDTQKEFPPTGGRGQFKGKRMEVNRKI